MKLLSNIHLLVPTRYRNKILASSKDKIPLLHITEFLQRQKGQRQGVAVRIYSGKSKRLLPQRSRIYTEKELGMKLRRQLPRWKSHYHGSQPQVGSGTEDSEEPAPGMQGQPVVWQTTKSAPQWQAIPLNTGPVHGFHMPGQNTTYLSKPLSRQCSFQMSD